MRRLTRAPNTAIAQIWVDLLCEGGYPATVQRQFLSGVAGSLPPDQCLPEIWLLHDEHETAAQTLLSELARVPQRRWVCHACGEEIEGGFEQCWGCGALMAPSD
ncbi:hypothetical protein [Ottowia thiooxydans]|uniref:hypothetical protein n=1 Tax=Ottowia thiooxydans TaxID=219182 RepID=UPI0003F8DB7E|nr:hypothetical protein [Ottowia thiooxydans]